MSSTPRSRSLSGVLFALLVIAILLALFFVAIAVGLDPLGALTRVWDSFFPPAAVTDRGQSIRDLYDIVFWMAACRSGPTTVAARLARIWVSPSLLRAPSSVFSISSSSMAKRLIRRRG